ncbi:MAG: hypothetical protein PHR35_22215 [Kiritimatiellae bacterium]|nr:hypothetical protein [Kiritimatiellia bacterium]
MGKEILLRSGNMDRRASFHRVNVVLGASVLALLCLNLVRSRSGVGASVSPAAADDAAGSQIGVAGKGSSRGPGVRTQPVSYEGRDFNRSWSSALDVRRHGILRDSGWDSLPCLPAVEFAELADSYILMLSVGELRTEDVRLSLEGSVLTVLLPRRGTPGNNAMARRFMLPASPAPDAQPHYSMTNGALRICVSKRTS